MPEALINICGLRKYPLEFNFRDGYDHSYYFISTFAKTHLKFHSKYLN